MQMVCLNTAYHHRILPKLPQRTEFFVPQMTIVLTATLISGLYKKTVAHATGTGSNAESYRGQFQQVKQRSVIVSYIYVFFQDQNLLQTQQYSSLYNLPCA